MKEGVYSNPYRWVVLTCFMLLAGVNQLLWLNFVPLLGQIQESYGVSEMMATSLTLCFPLLYVFLAMPSGAMVDRRGYRFTLAVGAIIMTLGTICRIYTESFWALLIGQILVAIAQPFILNGITKVAADWFEEHQRALATGLGTAGMFTGMAVGMAATPALHVRKPTKGRQRIVPRAWRTTGMSLQPPMLCATMFDVHSTLC